MKQTIVEQLGLILKEMNWSFNEYAYQPNNESLSQLGSKAEDLSVLIQYHLKFGDEK